MTLAQLLIFVPAAALVGISPGANNLLAFSNGSRNGFWLAVTALIGRGIAFCIMIGLVIAGLGALLATSQLAFQIVKWLGVAYLAYLGITMILSKPEGPDTEDAAGKSAWALAKQEFLVAMANPKAILLFTAFLPQFIAPESDFEGQLMGLGAIYIVIEIVAAGVYAFAGHLVKAAGPSAKRMLLVNRISGILMVGASALLSTSKRA